MTDASPARVTGVARRRRSWLWWLLPLGWAALIWTLSAQPELLPAVSTRLRDILSWLAHFGEFAAFAAFLWLALGRTTALAGRWLLAVVFLLAAAYAALDEFHQSFVPGRVSDPRDLAVDVIGILTALAVIHWLSGRYDR